MNSRGLGGFQNNVTMLLLQNCNSLIVLMCTRYCRMREGPCAWVYTGQQTIASVWKVITAKRLGQVNL